MTEQGLRVSQVILASICNKDELSRRIIPYVKPEYFESQAERAVFELAKEYMDKYHSVPPKTAMVIAIESQGNLTEEAFQESVQLIDTLYSEDAVAQLGSTSDQWILDQTETFIQDRAIYLGITQALKIIDGEDKTLTKGAIPKILQDALSCTLDPSIGLDYLEGVDERYDFFHKKEKRVRTRLSFINQITKGGFPKKTVTVVVAGTNVGKSLTLCSLCSDAILDGYQALYITNEMSEHMIAQRIDMNLLDMDSDSLKNISKEKFKSMVEDVKKKTSGKIIVKEYPTASANVNHFRALLQELRVKKNFKPDVIFLDYLNICASARVKATDNMYSYVKSIAEEIRGLAVEFDVPIVTATQTNRDGQGKADFDLDKVSESHGTSMTVDLMLAIISTEQLEQMGQFRFKQLKNRLGSMEPRSALIGVDRNKMRLFDVDNGSSFNPPPKLTPAAGATSLKDKFANFHFE